MTITDTELKALIADGNETTREACVKTAFENSNAKAKKDLAKIAVRELSQEELADIQQSLWPQQSGDRRLVYLVGFIVAGVVAIALALIAWGAADSGNESIATAVLVAMTGITGAILGGLFGAYKGQ